MAKDVLSRKEKRRLLDRSLIMENAAVLFARKGFHDVSMNDIASAAEFSVGTLYNFFKNKEELFEAIIKTWTENLLSHSQIYLQEQGDVLDVLNKYLEFINRFLISNVTIVRFYFVEMKGFGRDIRSDLDSDLRHLYETTHDLTRQLCRRGIQEGLFRDIDPDDIATALAGIFDAFLLDWVMSKDVNPEGIKVAQIIDLFLNGVRKQ